MEENWNISENRGGEVFLEIASIAQILSDIKKEGIKLFRRAIPFYPDTINIGIHHIRGGEPVNFQITPKKLFIWKLTGSRPPNIYIYIYIFYYFFYEGIALLNNLMPSFSKSKKNWAIDAISKKTSGPPLFSDIFQFPPFETFFWKLRQSLNFCSI